MCVCVCVCVCVFVCVCVCDTFYSAAQQRIFLTESAFSADSLTAFVQTPCVQLHASVPALTLNTPSTSSHTIVTETIKQLQANEPTQKVAVFCF